VHKSKGKVVPVHATKAYRMSGSVASPTLNLSTGWRYVVSLMPWPLHFTPEDKHPGTHGTGHFGDEENLLPPLRFKHRMVQSIA